MSPRRVAAVARDLLREARARRWVLGLFVASTLVLILAMVGLRLEVVDGALAASRLFGGLVGGRSIQAADVALRPLFIAVAYVVFYAGLAFGVLACADFAPTLLAPGRIEHLLSLPLRRAELVAGTFLGVLALVLGGALYGGLGMALIVWAKAGVFGWAPVLSAALSAAGFAAIYAVMMAAAVAVRSAALSAAAGGLMLVVGILAGYRRSLAPLFSAGLSRAAFLAVTAPLPRLSALADEVSRVADGQRLDLRGLAVQLGGAGLFALAMIALAISLLERKDF